MPQSVLVSMPASPSFERSPTNAPPGAEGERVADQDPEHAHHARRHQALHEQRERVLRPHQAGVEQRQPGQGHHQHQRAAGEQPRGVARVEHGSGILGGCRARERRAGRGRPESAHLRTARRRSRVRYGAMVLLHSCRPAAGAAGRGVEQPACQRARAEPAHRARCTTAGSREGCPRCRQCVPVKRRPSAAAAARGARPELPLARDRVGKREAMGPLERDRLEQLSRRSTSERGARRAALAQPRRLAASRGALRIRSRSNTAAAIAPLRRASACRALALLPHAAGRRQSDQRRRNVGRSAGPRLPHQGQKRKKPCETGPRQRAQRSGRSGWDQGRPGLRLQTGQ